MKIERSIAIAMPLYNEADGISETLTDLDAEFNKIGLSATFFIQNDCSTDSSLAEIEVLRGRLHGLVLVETNLRNQRHGPTTRRAYQRAVESGSEVVVQLDSDGQFDTTDVAEMVNILLNDSGLDLLIGSRKRRTDPWYRKLVTRSLQILLAIRFGVFSADPNSPIRVARTNALRQGLNTLPEDVLTPNVLLTVYFHRSGHRVKYRPTTHRIRRGSTSIGTMWSGHRLNVLIPKSLIMLCWNAAKQVLLRYRIQ